MKPLEPAISPKAAAVLLGVSPRKVQLMFAAGELEGFRVGRVWRTTENAVRRFIIRHHNHSAADLPRSKAVPLVERISASRLRDEEISARYQELIGGKWRGGTRRKHT